MGWLFRSICVVYGLLYFAAPAYGNLEMTESLVDTILEEYPDCFEALFLKAKLDEVISGPEVIDKDLHIMLIFVFFPFHSPLASYVCHSTVV